MPENKVQFQKGLSIPAFLDSYGEERQCEDALLAARWPDGLHCSGGGGDSFCRLGCRRAVFQCNCCKRQVSLLAGTIFESTKLPLAVWFLAMHLLSQAENGISALELGRQIGVSPNTAWLLKHKLMQVMLERDAGRKLEGEVQVDDAYLGGELTGGRRGRGSENETPFLAAVQVTEDGKPAVMKLAPVEAFRKDEVEEWAGENVGPGTRVHSDGLGCFRGFAAAGCEHVPHVTGGGPGSCETPGLGWVNTAPGNVRRALDGTYHRLDPKCAVRYLAEFQYRSNRRYDLAALPQRLLRAAVATLPLPRPVLELHPYGC